MSVVIPVFNGAAFLAEAVACVRSQTMQPIELIIVDDGSTDDTSAIVEKLGPGIRYVAQSNRGAAAARNHGLRLSRGNCVGFLDVDDLWPPDNLAKHMDGLAGNPTAEVTLGRARIVELPGAAKAVYRFDPAGGTEPPLLFMTGAALFRRSAFERVGLFDERKRFGEDLDWFVRARERETPLQFLPHISLVRRCHANNLTRGKSAVEMGVATVLRESLQRRRMAATGLLSGERDGRDER